MVMGAGERDPGTVSGSGALYQVQNTGVGTMKRIQCCYGCKDRYEACHDSCERYKEEKKACAEEREHIRSEKRMQADMDMYIVKKCEMLKSISKYARRKTK